MSSEQKPRDETRTEAASDKQEKWTLARADQTPPSFASPQIQRPLGPPPGETLGTVTGIVLLLVFVASGFLLGWDFVLEYVAKPVGIVFGGGIAIVFMAVVFFGLLLALALLLLFAWILLARLFGLARDVTDSYYALVLVCWIRECLDLDNPDPDAVRIPPRAFLRAMIAIAWSAFRHPFSTTVIDLSTGKVVQEG